MLPPPPRTECGHPSARRRGQAAIAALFWLLGLTLFVLPFHLGARQVPQWRAPDTGRKLDYVDEDDEVRDVPFLNDLADLQAYAEEEDLDWAGQDLDAIVSEASRRLFGRDFRGHFAPDRETYEELWAGESPEPSRVDRLPSAPIDLRAAAATGLFDVERLEPGERVYRRQCAGCHGLAGDGSGPAARFLDPRPRNYRLQDFKFTTTTWGSRPRREDLMRTITQGLVGSSMPAFPLLSEEKRWDLVEYVRFLAIQGEFEQTMLNYTDAFEEIPDPDERAAEIAEVWSPLREQYPASEEPPRDAASIERGRELFLSSKTECTKCHGEGGKGDGPNVDEYRDAWGYPIRPRDMTTGKLRVGLEGKDLWVLMAHGIKGTPMPGQFGALSSEEVWDLVHFVQELASGGAPE